MDVLRRALLAFDAAAIAALCVASAIGAIGRGKRMKSDYVTGVVRDPDIYREPPDEEPNAEECYESCANNGICERLYTLYGNGEPWDWCGCDDCAEYVYWYEGKEKRK